MPAVRGLATDADAAVRQAAYDAEMRAWPTVAAAVRRGDERDQGRGQHRQPPARLGSPARRVAVRQQRQPGDVRCDAGGGPRLAPRLPPLDASKASLHATVRSAPTRRPFVGPDPDDRAGLAWWDLFAPLPVAPADMSWDDGVDVVRSAFASTARRSAASSTGPLDEQWIDADPREGKTGGAFCMPFVDDRSLVLLNWTGSAIPRRPPPTSSATPTTTRSSPIARRCRSGCRWRSPRRPASSARRWWSRPGSQRLEGADRLALLDIDLPGDEPGRRRHPLAGSCSRPRSSPAASGARSAPPSSTR